MDRRREASRALVGISLRRRGCVGGERFRFVNDSVAVEIPCRRHRSAIERELAGERGRGRGGGRIDLHGERVDGEKFAGRGRLDVDRLDRTDVGRVVSGRALRRRRHPWIAV